MFEDIVRAVAESHDANCSPALRHSAREALDLGPCRPEQGCYACDITPAELQSPEEGT